MIEKLQAKFLRSRFVRMIVVLSKKIVLPGFDGQNIFSVARFFYEAVTRSSIPNRAAAISFKFLLAIFPALIVLLTLIPYIPIDNFQDTILETFAILMPADAYNLIAETLDSLVNRKYSTLLSVGFLLGLYFGSNTVQAILDGLHASHHIEHYYSPLKQRLFSLGLVITLPILAALALLVMAISGFIFEYLHVTDLIGTELNLTVLKVLKWIVSAFLIMLSISFLYNVADVKRKRWKTFSAGATVSTLGVIIVSLGFAFFVNNFGTYNKLYGSLGALLVTLVWIYVNFIALLVGFELNTSISKARRYGQELYNDEQNPKK